MIKIKIKTDDGWKEVEIEEGKSLLDYFKKQKDVIAILVNGEPKDLRYVPSSGDEIEPIKFSDPIGREIFRHSSSHLMAQAIKELYPDAKLAIGPAIEDGFYYDIDLPVSLTPEDLRKIEKKMKEIVKRNYPIERIEMSIDEAKEFYKKEGNPYKLEILNEIEDDTVSFYKQGDFMDLCRGPHLPSTGKIKAFKLLSIAGAYWRGDEKNKMLQRIYGTSFPNREELDAYIKRIEEAKKRDHRKIGKEMELFSLHEEGPGFPFFHPKGMVLWNTLMDFWRREHEKAGYVEIKTPVILNKELWVRSGHWDHYRENMYFTEIDGKEYAIKPMNCPGGMLVYKSSLHSYRELPIRMAEIGLVHRHELSGVLHGLMRVRAFNQDDAHIYMTPDQIKDEIKGVITLADKIYNVFGFDYHVELSTKPENAMGSDEIWEKATNALREALEELGKEYKINEGDGAFYGPKIDFHLKDSIGRTWQCGTIQLDFMMPERFDLTYINEKGERVRPVMLHRTVFGSIERFMGILIEHYAGVFPVWLAPEQIRILPVTTRNNEYAQKVFSQLLENGFRVTVKLDNEKIGAKIRNAELARVPYMLIIGDREEKNNTISVRRKGEGDLGSFKIGEFIERVKEEIKNYK